MLLAHGIWHYTTKSVTRNGATIVGTALQGKKDAITRATNYMRKGKAQAAKVIAKTQLPYVPPQAPAFIAVEGLCGGGLPARRRGARRPRAAPAAAAERHRRGAVPPPPPGQQHAAPAAELTPPSPASKRRRG